MQIYSVALSIFPLRLLSSPFVPFPETYFLLFKNNATVSELWLERIETDALLGKNKQTKHQKPKCLQTLLDQPDISVGAWFHCVLLDYLLCVR